MRFDDRIATVLSQPCSTAGQRIARWRQLIDLLAQRRRRDLSAEMRSALTFLRDHRAGIGIGVRREAARALAGLRVDPLLVALFADDHPSVSGPLIGGVRLAAEEWVALLPRLGPTARAMLRHRKDLPERVTDALAAFGAADLVLTGSSKAHMLPEVAPEAMPRPRPAERSQSQIRDLVARIEAFRQSKDEGQALADGTAAKAKADAFRWETGTEGVIQWVEGAPRGPLVGQSIAATAEHGLFGVDGQAAGAFEKRAPFRDARLQVAGEGIASGDWRISGVPFFNPASGSFLGYRGSARRPRLDEVARTGGDRDGGGIFGPALPADSLRQLIHELRTPLNAIIGFSEMIDGQFLGPAEAGYRKRAAHILDHARQLLSAVDDLDTAARIETRRFDPEESVTDAAALIFRLHEAYERAAGERSSRIAVEVVADLPLARVSAAAAERMFARLLAATIGLADQGETIFATLTLEQLAAHDMLCLSIDRPRAIAGLGEAALLDPGYSPDGDWPGAPALGLGFALRLVRNLAEATGGALLIDEERFSLFLPAEGPAERSAGQGGEGQG